MIDDMTDAINMRAPTKQEQMRALGALGLKKRYEKRNKLIEELKAFGGVQPKFDSYTEKQLQNLKKWWLSLKK